MRIKNNLKVFAIFTLLLLISCQKDGEHDIENNEHNTENKMLIPIYPVYINQYLTHVNKVNSCLLSKDSTFVTSTSKILLLELDKSYNLLKADESSNVLFDENLDLSYDMAKDVLSKAMNGHFSFEKENEEYSTLDFWMEYYVKYMSTALNKNAWFLFGNNYPSKEFLTSIENGEDLFSNQFNEKFAKIIGYCKHQIIGLYYYSVNDLKVNRGKMKIITEYDAILGELIFNSEVAFIFSN